MSANPFAPTNPFASKSFSFSNPFVTESNEIEVAQAGDSSGSYVMVQSAPAVPSEEVESMHLDAIEVVIKWGDNVLHVEHLSPVRPFVIGEEGADYVLPAATLGGNTRMALVTVDGGMPRVMAPQGAVATIKTQNGGVQTMAGGTEIALEGGSKMSFALPGTELNVEIAAVRAGKKVESGLLSSISLAAHKYTALSFVAHAALFAAFAFFMPKMNADSAEDASRDNILFMQKMLNASAERETEPLPQDNSGEATEKSGGDGQRSKGDEGQIGKDAPVQTAGRWAMKGDNRDPQLQRKADIEAAKDFGMVGLLASMSQMDQNAPAAPWGADNVQGRDERSALGNMWAPSIDEAMGAGGLGLTGTGEGGGGKWNGIGLGEVGTIGNGAGKIPGNGMGPGGMGNSSSPLTHGHTPKGPSAREAGPLSANGHLPSEVIQRVVRQNFGRFRACYESGLRTNPGLTGRVATKFVIGRDGSVGVSQDAGSDLPDQAVVSCVVRTYQSLSFPTPDSGIVTVTYPLMFTPGE